MTYACNRHGVPERYCHLIMANTTLDLLLTDPALFKAQCNGVGSKTGWARYFYRFIPNTILLLNVTPCSDIHDVEYVVPDTFQTREEAMRWKADADYRYFCNLEIHINRFSQSKWLRDRRLRLARAQYLALRLGGSQSFLEGKTILDKGA
jgi:hypothetical protein